MLRLIGLAISVGLADSLNPTTIAPALFLATERRPLRKVVHFTAGVFVAYMVGGAVIALGPGQLLRSILPHPGRHTRGIVEVAVGGVLMILAAYLWIRRAKLSEKDLPRFEGAGRSSALLGLTITAIELPTAFPYFAVIAAVVGGLRDPIRELLVLLVFNICFLAPMLAMIATLALFPQGARRTLQRTREWLERRWPHALSVLLLIAGVIVILLGATGVTPRHSRFGRLLHRLPLRGG